MFQWQWVLAVCSYLALAVVAGVQQNQLQGKDRHGEPLPPGAVARLALARGVHGRSPTFVQILPDGKRVVTVSNDSILSGPTICVWELSSSNDIGRIDLIATSKQLPGLKLASVESRGGLAFSPDGRHLATSEADGTIRIWEWTNAKQVRSFAEGSHVAGGFPLRVAFSPDGKRLASSSKVLLTYAPDGKSMISGPLQQKDKSYVLKIWDPATGAALCTIPMPNMFLDALVFSPDGKTLAACDWNSTVVWDATTGQRTGSPPKREITLISASTLQIIHANGHAAFSPDGRCLVADLADGTAGLYELATGQFRRTFGEKPETVQKGTASSLEPISYFAFSPDGKSLASVGRPSVVCLYDVQTGQELAAFKGHQDSVNAIAFAPDGKTVVSAGDDTTVLVWDVTKIAKRATAGRALQPDDLEKYWQALAGNDAAKAFEAIGDLTAAPREAVAWIKERLEPAAPLDKKRLEELLRQLDDNQFKVRDSATNGLLKMGEQIVPALDKALAANPALETKQRLEGLRGKLAGTVLQGERLRGYRAIEVLERIGTPEARQVLRALAEGAPGALITTSAQAALKRIAKS